MEQVIMKNYRKVAVQPMEPWTKNTPMSGVSVSPEDAAAGSPMPGDMIAHNPSNPADRWLVAKQFFQDNYEEVV